jgi:uncharacterized protein with GYD domain
MNSYVLLTTLTADGARSLLARPGRVREVNEEIEEHGCRVVSQFATLGLYDFVTIIEAPDNAAVLRLSAMLGSRGTMRVMSMPAVWAGDFLDQLPSAGARDDEELGG